MSTNRSELANSVSRLVVTAQQQSPIPLDVELDCEGGEVLALVGPSGAGKSTILRMIAGLMKPENGSIQCAGKTWLDTRKSQNLAPQQRRVGFVFQQYALFPHLSARQNVVQGCLHLPASQRLAMADHWLARVNLAGLEARKPSQLSGGQQQRVALARALAREPDVLLLDEPFSAVDRATRERLYEELAILRRDLSIPALLVTHDLDEAMMLSDRLCMLSQGVTLQTGVARAVLERPVSVLVARLVGLKNVFRATVMETFRSGDQAVIEWRGQRLEVAVRNGFEVGQSVHWCIPQSHIVMHRRHRPSRGERENPVKGTVADMLSMGDNAVVSVVVGNPDRPPLYFSVPYHVAQRNDIRVGVRIDVSLLADSIHLMPPDRARSRRQPIEK